jgi:CRISPR/Cas system-associated endonuclease Cas1
LGQEGSFNYAYAALESEIRIKAISDGFDPTIGIMQEGSDGSSKFIFDLMEPERPKGDRAVLDFVKGYVFDPADFVIRSDGVCRLNPEMARIGVRGFRHRKSTTPIYKSPRNTLRFSFISIWRQYLSSSSGSDWYDVR